MLGIPIENCGILLPISMTALIGFPSHIHWLASAYHSAKGCGGHPTDELHLCSHQTFVLVGKVHDQPAVKQKFKVKR